MSEIRVTRPDVPFAQVPHAVTECRELSWKAKGLFAYLVGRPVDWIVRRSDLERRSTDGKAALQSGLYELQKHGFLTIERERGGRGQITGTLWTLVIPGLSPHTDSPDMDNPDTGKTVSGESDPLTTSSSTKKEGKQKEEQGVCAQLWETWKKITGKSRYQLTGTRRSRLLKVLRMIRASTEDKHDRMLVWRVMVTCLWSEPWRRESRSRHDPVNVYRSDEQIEGWVLDAIDEIREGRDGSDFHLRQIGAVEREAAAAEESELQQKRVERKRSSEDRMQRLDAARTRELSIHQGRLKSWYEAQTPTERARIKQRVDTELSGRIPTGAAVTIAWTSILTNESKIRLGGGAA